MWCYRIFQSRKLIIIRQAVVKVKKLDKSVIIVVLYLIASNTVIIKLVETRTDNNICHGLTVRQLIRLIIILFKLIESVCPVEYKTTQIAYSGHVVQY